MGQGVNSHNNFNTEINSNSDFALLQLSSEQKQDCIFKGYFVEGASICCLLALGQLNVDSAFLLTLNKVFGVKVLSNVCHSTSQTAAYLEELVGLPY